MNHPLVSVLVPVHNAARWLADTLQSALAQTWQPIEIIVVDDGSTDESIEIAGRFTWRENVTLMRQANRGAAAARNVALAHARGEYIQYLDADDLLAPDKIAIQVKALRQGTPGKVASCAWDRFTHDPAEAAFSSGPDWHDQSGFQFLYDSALERGTFPPIAWLVPRWLCNAAGPWDERLSVNDDGEYFARVLARSSGIVFCGSARAYYRSNLPGSYSRRSSIDAARSELWAWTSIAGTLLALEDSPRVHHAVATGYQRIQATYYPRFPEIVAEAGRLERAHGRGAHRFEGGALFRVARHVFGWRAALRLRAMKADLGARRAASLAQQRSVQPHATQPQP